MLGAHRDGNTDSSQKQRRDTAYTNPVAWIVTPPEDKNGNIHKPENYVFEFATNENGYDELIDEHEKTPRHQIRATKSYLNDLVSHLDKIEVPSPNHNIDQTEIKHAVVQLYQLQKNGLHLLKQMDYVDLKGSSEHSEHEQEMREEIKMILNELQHKIEQCTDIIAEVPSSASVRRISKTRSYYGSAKAQSSSSLPLRFSGQRAADWKEASVLPPGVLEVAGKNLIAKSDGSCDPYVVVRMGTSNSEHSQQMRTKIVRKTTNPVWQNPETFSFMIDDTAQNLVLEVFQWNILTDKRMGEITLPLRSILARFINNKEDENVEPAVEWFEIKSAREKDKSCGSLMISIHYSRDDSDFTENALFTAIKNSDLKKLQQILEGKSIDDSYNESKSKMSTLGRTAGAMFKKEHKRSHSHGSPKGVLIAELEDEVIYFSADVEVNAKDNYGFTPLQAACLLNSENDDEILTYLLKHPKIDVNAQNEDQNTALHYFAAKFRSPNCAIPFQLFRSKGANVNVQNRNGETPLHKAVFNNTVRLLMVNLLLQAGADVNMQNSLGETSLHSAARLGREDLILALMGAGADPDIPDGKGQIPLDWAVTTGNQKFIHVLQRAKGLIDGAPTNCTFAELSDWLRSIGLEKYKTNLLKQEIYLDTVVELNATMLGALGITNSSDQSTLINGIKRLQGIPSPSGSAIIPKPAKKLFDDNWEEEDEFEEDAQKHEELLQKLEKLRFGTDTKSWLITNSDLEFTGLLGQGAFAKVYKGIYRGETVAIKVLKSNSAKMMDEFTTEFEMMNAIKSPYCVYFIGASLAPKVCTVMEFCELGTLYSVLNSENYQSEISWKFFYQCAKEITLGLQYLHQHSPQVLHRDIKSMNILMTSDWHCKLADFGLSRFNTNSQADTLFKTKGTPAYSAPEVYTCEIAYSTKSDVFSLAVLLWEIANRVITKAYTRPFHNVPRPETIWILVSKKGLRPTIPQGCPEKLAKLITQCWDEDPEKRMECDEVLSALIVLEQEHKATKRSFMLQ